MIGQSAHDAASEPSPQPAAEPVPKPDTTPGAPKEHGGRDGLDPVRYGDWEKNGRCIDF